VADVLIENATVITVDADRRVIEDGAVAIAGNKIVAVGPTKDVKAAHRAAKTISGRGKVVIPGLVDLYAHAGSGMLKALGEQLAGVGWWHLMDQVLFNFVTPEWWYVECQMIAAERLRFGCTAILTQPGLSHARLDRLEHIKQCGRAFDDIGIRAALIAGMPRSTPWVSRYFDFDNAGPAEPTRELAMVLFEFARTGRDRLHALVVAYEEAGGSGRVSRAEDFGVTIAQLHHIGRHQVLGWLHARDPEARARALAGVEEFVGDPFRVGDVERLLGWLTA